MSEFVSDIKKIRERAREHIERGAVTGGYKADRKRVIDVLNDVLATENVCALRYKHHDCPRASVHPKPAKSDFLQHAAAGQQQAEGAAEGIKQPGGEPNFNPEGL